MISNLLSKRTGWIVLGIFMLIGAISLMPAQDSLAQGGLPPIQLNETVIGQFSADQSAASYAFEATAGQESVIEVTSLAPGLVLDFNVYDSSETLLQAVENPAQESTISETVTFPAAGTYRIEVFKNSGTEGQFLLAVESAAPPVPVTPVNIGAFIPGTLQPDAVVAYGVVSSTEASTYLRVISSSQTQGFDVLIQNDSGETLLNSSGLLPNLIAGIPADGSPYRIVIRNSSTQPLSYEFEYSTSPSGSQDTAAPVDSTPTAQATEEDDDNTPDLPTTGPCKLATQGQIVNVREGPSTDYDQITTIGAFTIYDVLGRNEDGTWLQIDAQPETGWVSRSVTRQGGDCDNSQLILQSYPPLTGNLQGVIWHDLCAVPAGPATSTPPGCVEESGGGYIANSVKEAGEPGIGGVEVTLADGACPSTATLTSQITTGTGAYNFTNLTPGEYCVSINALSATNSSILIPGRFTAPLIDVNQYTISISPNATTILNFGWDYQFLPTP